MPDQYLSATPQSPIPGALAAALQRVLDYANQSGSYQKGRVDNPVLPAVADALMLPQLQRTLERMSYGDRLTEGSGETLRLKNDTTDAAMAALPMANALRKFTRPAMEAMPAALSGSKTAQRGAIRVGGDPDLYPYHGTSAGKLLKTATPEGSFELTSPSLGISKGGVDTSFATGPGGGVLLIPRVGAFDPATSPATLFNRDAYTPRSYQAGINLAKQSLERANDPGKLQTYQEIAGLTATQARQALLRGEVYARNGGRFSDTPSSLRAREFEQQSTGDWAHDEAIKGSPIFRSYANFERSPLGAALLMDKRAPSELTDGAIERWQQEIAMNKAFGEERLKELSNIHWKNYESVPAYTSRPLDPLSALQRVAENNSLDFIGAMHPRVQEALRADIDPEALLQMARQYRGLLKQTPSQYAENKVSGPVAINPENWAGAVMLHRPLKPKVITDSYGTYTNQARPGGLSLQQNRLFEQLPIPVAAHDTSLDDSALTALVRALQQQAGPARTHPLGAPYNPNYIPRD